MRVATGLSMGISALCCALAWSAPGDPLAPVCAFDKPAPAPIKPVTETLWGRQVTDDYRYMEDQKPDTIAWMKAQGTYPKD